MWKRKSDYDVSGGKEYNEKLEGMDETGGWNGTENKWKSAGVAYISMLRLKT